MKQIISIPQLCSMLGFALLALSCNAQESKNYTEADVAINSANRQIADNIFDIFEDSKGNLWLGTAQKGVAKYDGKTLTYYSEKDGLCGTSVANITEDGEGNLWFGTHMDLCRYDGENFQTLPRKEGVPILGWGWKDMGAGWKSVKRNKGKSIWVNSHHGMFYCDEPGLALDQMSFTEFTVPMDTAIKGTYCNTPGKISLDLVDSKGNLWFGTDGDGAYRFDGKSFTHYGMEEGLLSNNITNIEEDGNGNIWFACVQSLIPNKMNNGGLCVFNGSGFINFPDVEGLSENDIYTMYKDKSGNVWIGANGIGVYRYNTSEKPIGKDSFSLFREPKEVDLTPKGYTTGLQSIFEDSKGNIWLGYSGGLFRLSGSSLINVTTEGPWL